MPIVRTVIEKSTKTIKWALNSTGLNWEAGSSDKQHEEKPVIEVKSIMGSNPRIPI